MPDDNLPALTRDIRSLASGLRVLRVSATDDQAELAAGTVRELMQSLSKRYAAFEENASYFTRARRSIDPIRIGQKSYASAHAAAVREANSLCDFLWFHLDPDGRDSAPLGTIVRAGFASKLVADNWPVAKACILDRRNAEWANAFTDVPARIDDEIASIGPVPIASQEPLSGAEIKNLPKLDSNEIAVLHALANRVGMLCNLYDLEQATKIARKTVGNAVRRLIEIGYVERPNGKRKGASLTDLGLNAAKKLGRK